MELLLLFMQICDLLLNFLWWTWSKWIYLDPQHISAQLLLGWEWVLEKGAQLSFCCDLDPGLEFQLWEDNPPKPRAVLWTPQFMAELGWGCHTTQDWSFQMQPGTQNAEYSHYWRSAERVLPSRSLEIPMELSIHRSIQHLILVCFPVFKASRITELHLLTKPHFYSQEGQTFILRGECYKIAFLNPLVFYFERFFWHI